MALKNVISFNTQHHDRQGFLHHSSEMYVYAHSVVYVGVQKYGHLST